MYNPSDYDGITNESEARACRARTEARDGEARETRAEFLAREAAIGVFLDAMSDEDQHVLLALDAFAQEEFLTAALARPLAAAAGSARNLAVAA